MEFLYLTSLLSDKTSDALLIPFWQEKEQIAEACVLDASYRELYASVLQTNDFKAKEGQIVFVYTNHPVSKRFILLGLGEREKITPETYRKCYGSVIKACFCKPIQSMQILLPLCTPSEQKKFYQAIIEGVLLPSYLYPHHKSVSTEEDTHLLKEVTWIGQESSMVELSYKIKAICQGVNYARDLVNGNADDVNSQHLVACAEHLSHLHPILKTTIFDKKRIEQENMGLLLAVNRGSTIDPAFIIMQYDGSPGHEDHTIIIGKGVTYDTGGLNLKPTGGLETMKCDMAGAAACLGIMAVLPVLKPEAKVTIVIPTTENSIDANSFKPGDVYKSYSGQTVEMTNSDAEGRLILADALAYACKNLQPSRIIDIATLTGAIEIALGDEASGLMSSCDELAKSLIEAGETTQERVWRMPLYEEYKEKLKSDIADFKSWNGRSASSSVAAIFLQQFVDKQIPWAHLDIAGTAYVNEAKKYLPKYATGVGVRLLVEFIEKFTVAK